MNLYNPQYINPVDTIKNATMPNTIILDKKTGDVNGDKVPDRVYLTGEKTQNPFFENIKVIVQDGRTMQRFIIPLAPNYSLSTGPWLFLGNFISLSSDEIMVNLPTPGSGALTYYYIISFLNNNASYILGPQQFVPLTDRLGYEVVYMDNYKVCIKSSTLNQSYTLDVSNRKDVYEGTVYDKDGKLIKPLEGFVIDFPHLFPVRFEGSEPYKLQAHQDIAGTSHADQLGTLVTYWKYSYNERNWVLDPEMFFVMI